MNRFMLLSFCAIVAVWILGLGSCDVNGEETPLGRGHDTIVVSDQSDAVTAILEGKRNTLVFQNADKVIVLRPYSNVGRGSLHNMHGVHQIQSDVVDSDGVNLLVFVQPARQQILRWADVPRSVTLRKTFVSKPNAVVPSTRSLEWTEVRFLAATGIVLVSYDKGTERRLTVPVKMHAIDRPNLDLSTVVYERVTKLVCRFTLAEPVLPSTCQ